jgi:hypothetical protein
MVIDEGTGFRVQGKQNDELRYECRGLRVKGKNDFAAKL